MTVAERLEDVRAAIAAVGRDPDSVEIVAVTKGFGPEAVAEAAAVGLAVGENYAQEMLAKVEAVAAHWHFLGSIQRNKVQLLAPHVHTWHGLARVEEARSIARVTAGARAFVQVDLTGRNDRGGCRLDDLAETVAGARGAGLDVLGLMTVAPREDPTPAFRVVAREAEALGLTQLSMGMSGDFRLAVAEGATIIRLGTALFGPRPTAAAVRR